MPGKNKIIAIVQARENSSRFPNKVLKYINEKTILEIINSRLKKSKNLSNIVFAIPKNDKKIQSLLIKRKINYFLGSEKNVLERFYKCAKKYKANTVVRITADCPLVDFKILDKMIKVFLKKKPDYISNTIKLFYPDGLDIEILNFKSLETAFKHSKSSFYKEHVTFYITKNISKFKILNFKENKYLNNSDIRLTVDNNQDLTMVDKLFKFYNYNFHITYEKISQLIQKKPEFFLDNKTFKRNYGLKNKRNRYSFENAKKIIPTGNQMLSKNPNYILPFQWPLYYRKAKGCKIISIDNRRYFDFSLMGVGSNILGYSNQKVDNFVKKKIDQGSMSTLNCYEEFDLADELLKMNNWADMVRFSKTGGEINSMAIRIARAASGKDNVAFCGYHGWHDWYLSANLKNNKNLDNHLMSGFYTAGVPKFLSNKSYPFKFNNINSIKQILAKDKNIGVIKMEVYRNIEPKISFLKKLRKICDKEGIVLIFDECTSGFRENYGGIYKKFGINPDMVLYGKALGNGYPITACVGKKEIMENVNKTFISSTFWSERTGFSAGIATLNEMKKINSWLRIRESGKLIRKGWLKLSKKYNFKISFSGLYALTNLEIKNKNWNLINTLITQEMLSKGFLYSNSIYTSVCHNKKNIDLYFNCLDEIFSKIEPFMYDKKYLIKNLKGPLPKKPFNRMN